MKRAILAALVLFSSALFAQVRGVPASVTSLGSGTMAPAASVTSLGPNGYNFAPCLFGCGGFGPATTLHNGVFTNGRNFNFNGNLHGGRGHHRSAYSGGYVYTYAYPYPVVVVPQEEVDDQGDGAAQVNDRRPVARPEQYEDEDSRYGEHYLDSRERRDRDRDYEREQMREQVKEAPAPATHEVTATPEPEPIVVIFKDGHQKEIKNYAIMGDTLYELGAMTSFKIKLSDIDLKATINKNEERGVEFNVPPSLKPKA